MRKGSVVHRGVLSVLTCCLLTVGGQTSDRVSNDELLRKPLGRLGLDRGTLPYAFGTTLRAARVSGGIAMIRGCEAEPPRNFPVLGPTLGDALAALQKAVPEYEWRVADGVVDLAPTEGFPPLLQTSLREFDSKDANNFDWAVSLVMGLPEVREARSRLGFSESPNEIQLGLSAAPKKPTTPPLREPPLDVHCKGCSIFEVLNALVRARRHGLWVYSERHCGGIKTFRIAFSE